MTDNKKTVQDITTETLDKGLPDAILGNAPDPITQEPDPTPQSPFADLSVKDLQKEAVKLGMPEDDAKLFTTKAPLIATINTLKAQGASKVVEVGAQPVVAPATLNAVDPKEEKQTEQRWLSKAARMYEYLEAQPKVAILIPCEVGEKPGVVERRMIHGINQYIHISGAVWSKTFNGFRIIVPKGVQGVQVPQDIAQNIADEFNLTQAAGEQWKIDRVDPITGKTVREQLS